MPNGSKRGNDLNQSPIRGLVPYARQAKAAGREVIHLNIGQPDIETPPAALEKIKVLESDIIKYGPSEGLPSLRARVRDYYDKYQANLSVEDIFVTTGASEAIMFALFAVCNEGEEIIVPEPFYANYIGFAQVSSVSIVPLSTTFDSGFDLPDLEAFEELITNKTKAIFLCNPGNPTGKVYDKKQLDQIIELVKKKNIFLIVDEVYREFCYDNDFTSVLSYKEAKQNVIVIDSISKVFSSCGARVGYLITKNEEIKKSVIKYAQMRLCPPYFGQQLAEACYDNHASYIEKAKQKYTRRRKTLYQGLTRIKGVEAYLPDGAFYNIIKLPVEDANAFCTWLLSDFSHNNHTVMMAPADGFYINQALGASQVRIAYVLNEERLKLALKILEKGLEQFC